MTHLHEVLTIARDNNLKLNCDELRMGLPSVAYLGHQLTQGGLAPDPDKVKSIKAVPAATNKAELQRFLGMATYLMTFTSNFSAKTQPHRELLEFNIT